MSTSLDASAAERITLSSGEAHALWAPVYDEDSNPLLRLEERSMESLVPALEGKHILDLACGTGRWLERMLQRGARHAVGFDLSPEMLGVASGKTHLAGRLARASLLNLPVRDGSIDFAILSFAVGYIPHLQILTDEIARISSPGACVLISDFHPDAYERGWKRSFRNGDRVVQITAFKHAVSDIRIAFVRSGFVLEASMEPALDEPERKWFERAGKLQHFDSLRGIPAIFVLRFRYLGELEVNDSAEWKAQR